MDWLEALTLAVIQGLTEFLPVSSSGHLSVADAAFEAIRGAPTEGGLFFAVMLHVGTLGAIVAYYRKPALRGAVDLVGGGIRRETSNPAQALVIRSVLLACVATLPAVVVGLGLEDQVEAAFESRLAPAFGFLVTATLLLAVGRLPEGEKGPSQTSWRDALLVGMAQAIAITPGISRSGSTIAAALALGFSRTWAVGFSLLMAVPAILGAALLEAKDIDPGSLSPETVRMTASATALAGVIGYGAIAWLVRIVRAGRLWYFSVYLLVMSGVVLGSVALSEGPSSSGERRGERSSSVERTDGQGRRSEALDRPGGVILGGSGAGAVGGVDLGHADPAGQGSSGPSAVAGVGDDRPVPVGE
ncbi:undecaprenyl-diphosphate phosphatase [Tautonia sociabilis]|uniref:Undecaprenyl-diphosphatase n=1 Tax=Tautonia sociabilis TaxID=2080755 RepID=A0A432MP58_9BACT|nr:undecaprenyl-diphosphate phosphatase [Tautonia sociabilis]RUL88858.1 undecaprenyl-diphosphate phosphatase [Tautonia sociabilis]